MAVTPLCRCKGVFKRLTPPTPTLPPSSLPIPVPKGRQDFSRLFFSFSLSLFLFLLSSPLFLPFSQKNFPLKFYLSGHVCPSPIVGPPIRVLLMPYDCVFGGYLESKRPEMALSVYVSLGTGYSQSCKL